MRTYTEEDEKRYGDVLREIQTSVPIEWRKKVVIKKDLTPTVKMVFEKALESETITDEKKSQIRNVLESGELSREVYAEDPVMAKKIDNFVNRRINKAIKDGKLPPKSHVKYLPSVIRANRDPNEKKAS
jgi:hypothetical protein